MLTILSPQIFGFGVNRYFKVIVSVLRKSIFQSITCPVCTNVPLDTEIDPATMLKLLFTVSLLNAVPGICAATQEI